MNSKQFCSVCKEWLDMEIVASGDAEEDDGVTWFRCPGCQGFLPKLTGSAGGETGAESAAETPDAETSSESRAKKPAHGDEAATEGAVDSSSLVAPVIGLGSVGAEASPTEDLLPSELIQDVPLVGELESDELVDDSHEAAKGPAPEETKDDKEPLAEYAAMLAETDPEQAVPYRPWKTYEVGQCVLHLAWNDCGVVVDKESLPGGRQVIKCFFSEAGIVRLIENAPR